jgi:hypothetical protein
VVAVETVVAVAVVVDSAPTVVVLVSSEAQRSPSTKLLRLLMFSHYRISCICFDHFDGKLQMAV